MHTIFLSNYAQWNNCEFTAALESTYTEAFPPQERRDFSQMIHLSASDPRFTIYIFTDTDHFLGFLTAWEFESFLYIEHFAIDARHRSGGWGKHCLKAFLCGRDKPVVLEVEPPVEDLAKRRIAFYKRLGFVYHPVPYVQPPYRPGDTFLPMKLMSLGSVDLEQEFYSIRDTLYTQVYGWKG